MKFRNKNSEYFDIIYRKVNLIKILKFYKETLKLEDLKACKI